jgi:23S rRNA (guanosine2251-2'-O)-methyltransferase
MREPLPGRRSPPRAGGRAASHADPEHAILYGFHPVAAALANPARRLRRLLATENALHRLTAAGIDLAVAPELVRPGEIDRLLTPDAVHQGLLLEADPLPPVSLDALPPGGLVLVLDQITDPHNVGAILRSAAAFAVDAVVTTARHSPAATGVLAKAASGALEHVPIALVTNLALGIEALQARGYRCIGLDSDASETLDALAPVRPVALVLGAEGKGLRARTRATCDGLARLDLPGAIRSLNVSNAAAVALQIAATANRR